MKKAVFVFFAGLGIAFSATACISDPCTCLAYQQACEDGDQISCAEYKRARCWLTNPYDCPL